MNDRNYDRLNLSNGRRGGRALSCSLLLALVLGLGTAPSHTASIPADALFTPEDFGYGHMTVNGQPSLGHRPLLVILANFDGGNSFAHDLAYYDNLVFNWTRKQSLNGYFLANSNGRFMWARAGRGIIGPVQFGAGQRYNQINNDTLYFDQILGTVWNLGLFNFVQFDSNGDRRLTPDELGILIITNDGDTSGGADPTGYFELGPKGNVAGYAFDNCGMNNVAGVNHQTGFLTIAHELCHLLGAVDLYGSGGLSSGLTSMSSTGGLPDDMTTCHLDPWHKMQLGWDEPRIEEITSQKWTYMPVAQLGNPRAPLILYDSRRGPDEYFILEARTPKSAKGGGYDDNVAGTGLVIWHVLQDENKNAKVINSPCMGPIPGQPNWRWCSKCQGLHHIGDWSNPVLGPCPASGNHEWRDSAAYTVVMNAPSAAGEHGWHWCRKCRGLYWAPSQGNEIHPYHQCPAGAGHDGSQSAEYSLIMDNPTGPGQYGWQWCGKCYGLFYGPNQLQSRCPAGGQHQADSSAQYSVLCDARDVTVFSEGSPNLGRGGSSPWSNIITPYLRWSDGTQIIPSKIWVPSSYSSWGFPVSLGNY